MHLLIASDSRLHLVPLDRNYLARRRPSPPWLSPEKMASNQHAASWRARKPSQGLLVVHLPDVKAQRQKVIASKWSHPLARQGSSHVVDMTGPTLPRPCRTRHGAKTRKRNLSNAGRKAKQSFSCTLSQFVFLENGAAITLFLFPDFSEYMSLCGCSNYYCRSINFYEAPYSG